MKIFVKLSIIVVLVVIFWIMWQKSDAVIIDAKYHFTHENIDDLYNIEMELAKVIGKSASVVKSTKDVLYNLVITSMQKSILAKGDIKVDKEKAIEYVEAKNKIFSGLYSKFKQKLGDELYYLLLIEPVAISEIFVNFYKTNEPANKQVLHAIEIAKKDGLKEAAKFFKKDIIEFIIPNNNVSLIKSLKNVKQEEKLTYNTPVKIKNNFAALMVKSINEDEKRVVTDALVFEIMPYRAFLSRLVKGVNLEFPKLSRYSLKDIINKKGSILQ